jgi:hypothetical protein
MSTWRRTRSRIPEDVVLNAGTHVDTIRMKYKDFERLVQPKRIHAALAVG